MNCNHLIGLCGFAKSGKNSFADFIIESRIRNKADILGLKTLSFAHALRRELEDFVYDKIGISTFTQDPVEKEIIRPLLVCWGTDIIRNKINKDYWVEKIKRAYEINRKNKITSIITDVRFENELNWIQKEGGIVIFIDRDGIKPINSDELEFTQPLASKSDFRFEWPNLENFNEKGSEFVQKFLTDNNLCYLTKPTNS